MTRPVDLEVVLSELGVRPVINAGGTKSRFGGRPLSAQVREAICSMWDLAVDVGELNRAVGSVLASRVGSERGLIVNGAAGGTLLAVWTMLHSANDVRGAEMSLRPLPRRELIVMRHHMGQYSYLMPQAGAKLVEVGYVNRVSMDDIEHAMSERVCGIVYLQGPGISGIGPSLTDVVGLANSKQIPVLVSAAAILPPWRKLQYAIECGASLVVASGGKYLAATQTSGLLFGARHLIDIAETMLHPNLGAGRALKLSKEDIISVYAAMAATEEGSEDASLRAELEQMQLLADGLKCERCERVTVEWDSTRFFVPSIVLWFAGGRASNFARHLLEHEPRVFVRHYEDLDAVAMERSCCTFAEFAKALEVVRVMGSQGQE